MKQVGLIAGVVLCAAVWVSGQQPATHPETQAAHPKSQTTPPDTQATPSRFTAVDIFVDSGDLPLAAYQFELSAAVGSFKIVGVEGGEHAAFAEPPYYDPAALHGEGRIIIAAFNTGDDLPTGRTRVARVHVWITGEPSPDFDVKLIVAGSVDGEEIEATIEASVPQ